jgi:hypothetical protein
MAKENVGALQRHFDPHVSLNFSPPTYHRDKPLQNKRDFTSEIPFSMIEFD